jgi:hypothetical protein
MGAGFFLALGSPPDLTSSRVEEFVALQSNPSMREPVRWQRRNLSIILAMMVVAVIVIGPLPARAGDRCEICRLEISGTMYRAEDQVTHGKYFACAACLKLPDVCYLCSRPVRKDFTVLPDGRVVCDRDGRNVIIDDQVAAELCAQVKADLDRQFSRFLELPETNVTVGLMDRVRLQELYKIIGKDYACPDTRGLTETRTNAGQRQFVISILSGQIRDDLLTTCVHEHAHTWIIENVPPERQNRIGRDAVEGFCELLAYLYAEDQGLSKGLTNILRNHYTRGQINLFLEAHKRYGLQDIIDWMKMGEDPLLRSEDLSRVRRLEENPPPPGVVVKTTPQVEPTAISKPKPQLLPTSLLLQGIAWSKVGPLATVNDRNLTRNETVTIQLRSGPMRVRCVEIQPHSVVLETNQSPAWLTLRLK